MPKAVARIGDRDNTHCSIPYRLEGSNNVFVNGIAVSRQGDLNTIHQNCNDNDVHQAPITTGSLSVFVNGLGLGSVGDEITGCTSVREGSPNVFIN